MKRKFKRKLKRKKSFPRIRFSFSILPFFLIILTIFIFYSSWKIEKKREELNLRIKELKEEISILQAENKTLKEQGFLEKENSEYLEKLLREKGLYKKEGEEVVVILPPKKEEKEEEKKEEKNFWQKILEKFDIK